MTTSKYLFRTKILDEWTCFHWIGTSPEQAEESFWAELEAHETFRLELTSGRVLSVRAMAIQAIEVI